MYYASSTIILKHQWGMILLIEVESFTLFINRIMIIYINDHIWVSINWTIYITCLCLAFYKQWKTLFSRIWIMITQIVLKHHLLTHWSYCGLALSHHFEESANAITKRLQIVSICPRQSVSLKFVLYHPWLPLIKYQSKVYVHTRSTEYFSNGI